MIRLQVTPVDDTLIRELAAYVGERAPVTSLYLDVDGRRYVSPREVERQLASLARRARQQASELGVDREAQASVDADLARIDDLVRLNLDRSRLRGLAVFACSAQGLWRVVELAATVPNRVVVAPVPHVRELEGVAERAARIAVLLADRQRARLFVFHQGEAVERSEVDDPLPRHDDDGGELTRDQVAGHVAASAHRHLRRAAQAAFALFRETGFDALVIGAPDEISRALEKELHAYLRDRIVARTNLPVGSGDDDVAKLAAGIEEQVERDREVALVERLRAAIGSSNGAVAGLESTLGALVARRVGTLLVSEDFEAPGWRCASCAYMGVLGRGCPVCGAAMERLDDVVEAAIEEAVGQSCSVVICRGNADLDVMGRIGALLRF